MPTFIRPSNVTHITASFSAHKNRTPPSANPGVDYGAATGTNVLAPADGMVTQAQWSSLVGNWLHIDHDGKWAGYSSDLLHNSKLLVKPGTWVRQGTHIAESGGTGSVATGPHIHWSLRKARGHALQNYANIDGEKYVAKVTATDQFVAWLTATYVKKMESALGVTADGKVSSSEIKVLQKKVGTPQDGKFGGNSVKALQKFIGLTGKNVDGLVGPTTIAAWKKAIDAGKFGELPPVQVIRTTGKSVVNVRPLPSTKSAATVQAKANTKYVVTAFAHGESVNGNDVWFKLTAGWAWSGGFTSQSTSGLMETKIDTPAPTGPTQAEFDAVVKARNEAQAALEAANANVTKLQAVIAAVKKAVS